LAELLELIRRSAGGKGVRLRAVTSLAEGADRLFGEAAVAAGYEIACIMPFPQARFEQDFAVGHSMLAGRDSVQDFRELLDRARARAGLTVLELDGEAHPAAIQYQPAARTVLNQSDLLIVVWDGVRELAAGGTFETLSEALAAGTPVVWVDPATPTQWRLLRDEQALQNGAPPADPASLAALVTQLLQPSRADQLRLAQYLGENAARRSPALWSRFRAWVGARLPSRSADAGNSHAAPATRQLPASVSAWLTEHIGPHYERADRLARIYGDYYRSSFLRNYLLGFIAVCFALLPIGSGWSLQENPAPIIGVALLEWLAVIWIVWTVYRGNRQQWHQRWLEYRVLAELFRQQYVLLPLGMLRSAVSSPTHMRGYGVAEGTWMYRYVRGIARNAGLPVARVDAAYLRACASALGTLIGEQQRFHEQSARRDERIEKRLHGAVLALSLITVIFVGAHLAKLLWQVNGGEAEHGQPWLAIACAVLPALGATLTAINSQGEFVRIAKRSRAMAARFSELGAVVAALTAPARPLNLAEMQDVSYKISQMMVAELLDWRVVFMDQSLQMHA
jgi:hypothetical protein